MSRLREPFLIPLFFAIVFFIGHRGLSIIENEHRLSVGESLNTVIHTIEEALSLWTNNHRAKVETIAHRTDLIDLTQQILDAKDVHQFELVQGKIRDLLNPEIIAFGYKGFFIISPEAINMSSMRDTNIGQANLIAHQRRDLFEKALAGETLIVPPIFSDVPLQYRDSRFKVLPPTMFAVSPIRNHENSIIAVLAIRIDSVNSFSRLMRLGRIGNSGETYVFDHQGVMLTESRFEDQLLALDLIDYKEGSSLNIQLLDPGVDLTTGADAVYPPSQQPFTYLVQSALNQVDGDNVNGYRDYRGVMVIGSWKWYEELGVGIATEIDVSEAMKSFVISRNAIFGILFLTTALAVTLTSILLRNRSKAVELLEQNKLSLEGKVAERTESLLKVNSDLQSQIVERVRTEEKLKLVQMDLENTNQKLTRLASTDGLTGISNRRTFDIKLSDEWQLALKLNTPISLLLMDVDDFKKYNDTFGHQAGDLCLKQVAEILKLSDQQALSNDIVARYGGEEFVIVLRNTKLEDARIVAETIRSNLLSAALPYSNSGVEGAQVVTLSIGVATVTPKFGQSFESLVKQADEALYRAKALGKNRVVGG
ncbi:diguanylate cyclase [Vibrio gallaecicus]|uniref:sensor domain-containing diguanylate cyclase n=1 Tax=Vibrio gallaecicus TaxID=552386 RepID=UPI0010C96D35|nr:diguanylate cyclase [Vibrio gallaecicus]MDN3616653.1 diguanylate cyclase [Vibrio gallaecicus]